MLRGTTTIANLIRDEKTYQIHSAMQIGKSHGMQTFDPTASTRPTRSSPCTTSGGCDVMSHCVSEVTRMEGRECSVVSSGRVLNARPCSWHAAGNGGV